MSGEKRTGNPLTHDIDGTERTSNAIWIVLNNISRLENSLDGTGFDVELVVAETVFSRRPFHQSATNSAACKYHAWTLDRYLSSGEKFQSVTAP